MLPYDYDLSHEDIQDLSGRDGLVAFFAKLGYDTNVRLEQNLGAMGITNETLKSTIQHIERLAHFQAVGLVLEVYLFEIKSVTVAATQQIVRLFRNRPDDYLLVLTDDYQTLDFVLVERYTSTTAASQETLSGFPSPTKQVGVRPRVLTVNRRDPDLVAQRVLRRFSLTEHDTFAQYDKLLSAYDVAEWSKPFFNNRALFSDYYLMERLSTESIWKEAEKASSTTQAFRKLRALYVDVRETFANQAEETIRTKLLEPVLTELGFRSVPVKAPRGESGYPDYRLYAASSPSQPSEKPLAVCLTYPWARNLDGKDEQRDNLTPEENPGASVVTLLDNGETDWAIVTNGKTWRLYCARAHSRATNYYEVDLEETLALPSAYLADAFRYFWLFFRADAFLSLEHMVEGKSQTRSFLGRVLAESTRYARTLGEKLKNRVFDEIFLHFARGFISQAQRNNQLPTDLLTMEAQERDLWLVPYFNGTLTFLYRLLFLLYAESRDLLPVNEVRGYYEISLEKLKQEIALKAGNLEDGVEKNLKTAYSQLRTGLYERLLHLFNVISEGNAAVNVPMYDGGLFLTNPESDDTSPEAEMARFLQEHTIPDYYLALGLDRMARDVDEKLLDLAFIDYKSLGVRHLGSIYEGLLEFKIHVASEKMAYVKGKRTEEIVPYSEAIEAKRTLLKEGRGKEAIERTLAQGTAYLENNLRERKATGSYYTPDYIVKYIVVQTIGPILLQKLEILRPLFREAEQTLRSERSKTEGRKTQRTSSSDPTPEQITYERYQEQIVRAFFDLKILDPAMGSGHFLVEAVDYITDQMAKFLSAFKWNPVVYELAETRRQIQKEIEDQGMSIDIDKLTDLNLLKRHVVKSCVYGVDLNPMAVELAKVSLWLDCFTLGAPLSFLDHHMKYGNALFGGSISAVQDTLRTGMWSHDMADLLNATDLMRKVGEYADITAKEVGTSRTMYKEASHRLLPFKRLLHVWLSEAFGNKGAKETVRMCSEALLKGDYSTLNKEDKDAIAEALELARTKRFVHWDLEFPEVFFDKTGPKAHSGFDAVIGNPPYVRQEGLGADKGAFKAMYAVYNSIADLYTYFIEQAHAQLRQQGRFGMITANKFMRANYGAALRSFLMNQVKLEQMVDFGGLPVFEDAIAYPIILLSSHDNRNGAPIEYFRFSALPENDLLTPLHVKAKPMPESAFTGTNWSLASDDTEIILQKMRTGAISLDEYIGGKIKYGVKTGFNEAFVIDKATRDKLIEADPRNAEILKPFMIGEDVQRYKLQDQERFLIWTYIGVPIEHYPAIYQHLQQYQEQLEKRWDKGKYWWELRACDYYDDFAKPKIVYPEFADNTRFAYDRDGHFVNNKTFFIPMGDFYLLALLNSSPMFLFFQSELSELRGGFLEYRAQHVLQTPIYRIADVLPQEVRLQCFHEAQSLYQAYVKTGALDPLLAFTNHHLTKAPQEADVIRDVLAFLAQEMLEITSSLQSQQKEVLDWLIATLQLLPDKSGRRGIEILTGRMDLLNYLGDHRRGTPVLTFSEIFEILQKNRKHFSRSLNESEVVDQLRSGYALHLEKVLPMRGRLAQTDALIDQIVYRLYGLTEEEVKLVEARNKAQRT